MFRSNVKDIFLNIQFNHKWHVITNDSTDLKLKTINLFSLMNIFCMHDFRSSSFWRVQTQHKLLDLDEEPVPIYVMNRVIQRYY